MTTTTPDTSREAIEALAYRLGVIANEEVVGKPLVDVYPDARDGRAALLALLERAEAAEGEIDLLRVVVRGEIDRRIKAEDARDTEREKVEQLTTDNLGLIVWRDELLADRDAALEEAKRLREALEKAKLRMFGWHGSADIIELIDAALTPTEPKP